MGEYRGHYVAFSIFTLGLEKVSRAAAVDGVRLGSPQSESGNRCVAFASLSPPSSSDMQHGRQLLRPLN